MKTIKKTLIFIIACLSTVYANDDSWMVFDDLQVAIIKVTMDTSALNWMMHDDNVESDSMHLAQVRFTNFWLDETIDSVAIRLRGNTSRQSAKKSFKLSFNTFINGREFHNLDKLNINGEHNDPSVVRSKLSWDLFKKVGLTASRAFYTALYINENYFGLYIVVEHIDDEFINKNYADDSGNLWKCLWPADLVYIDSDPDAYKYFNEQSGRYPYELKTNEEQNDYSALARFIDIINNTIDKDLPDSLEKIIHVEKVLKYMAINVLTGSWDDYWFNKNNFYIYHEPADDRFHLIPYDYDNTFGISWFTTDWTDVDPYYFAEYEGQQGSRPLTDRILEIPSYRNLYTHFLEYYIWNVFDLSHLETRIDSLKALIRDPWIANDQYYTYSYGFTIEDFDESYLADGYYFDSHVRRGLKEYINLRVEALNKQLHYVSAPPAVYHPEWTLSKPGPNDTIYVQISAFSSEEIQEVSVALVDGDKTTMYLLAESSKPGNLLVEIADSWSGYIPPVGEDFQGGFYFVALDKKEQTGRYPSSTILPLYTGTSDGSGLVINEFLADNAASNQDQDGEYDDWLELYNAGSDSQLISGLYLTDNKLLLNKWQISGDKIYLQPGKHLIIWCDEDEQQGYHANFKLSKNGEFIALTASDGITVLDSISFGSQQTDISFGRYPDGNNQWNYMDPTPGAQNIISSINNSIDHLPGTFDFLAYPNPFNSNVAIRYDLPEAASVSIKIFNNLGQVVLEKKQGFHMAGNYQVKIDMNNSATGLYYLLLNTGKHQMVKKILLIR